MVGMAFDPGQLVPNQLLDSFQNYNFTGIAERERSSGSASSCGSADAMNISFGVIGKLIIDHMRDVCNVDTTCGDVCSNEDPDPSSVEIRQAPFSPFLSSVRVDCIRRNSFQGKMAHQAFGPVLGSREYQRSPDRVVLQNTDQECRFVALVYKKNFLIDLHGNCSRYIGCYDKRILQHVSC